MITLAVAPTVISTASQMVDTLSPIHRAELRAIAIDIADAIIKKQPERLLMYVGKKGLESIEGERIPYSRVKYDLLNPSGYLYRALFEEGRIAGIAAREWLLKATNLTIEISTAPNTEEVGTSSEAQIYYLAKTLPHEYNSRGEYDTRASLSVLLHRVEGKWIFDGIEVSTFIVPRGKNDKGEILK